MSASLRRRLTWLTLWCIAAVMIPLLFLSYAKIVEEVNELSDARLSQSAKTLEALVRHVATLPPAGTKPVIISNWVRPKGAAEASPSGHGYETQIGFQFWASPTDLRLTTQDLENLTFDAAPVGFAEIDRDKRRWRIYTKIGEDGGFIRAAERNDSRREIVRDLLAQNTVPILIGLPLLALLLGWAVRRGLAPLTRLTGRLVDRAPEDTGPLDAHDVPQEVVPLVTALNGLLQRLRNVMEKEREFTANAAHELRTPLAGALIHVENAMATSEDAARAASLTDAKVALGRMVRLVNQLLELARWDAASRAHPFAPLELARLIDEEVDAIARYVAERNVRIERDYESPASTIMGWDGAVQILVRNVLDNAIRYGPDGGRITITTMSQDNAVAMTICDEGPGIAAEQRDAMTGRFHRGQELANDGAGLGLSIVKRIAELHDASWQLLDPPLGRGLCVRVLFRAAR